VLIGRHWSDLKTRAKSLPWQNLQWYPVLKQLGQEKEVKCLLYSNHHFSVTVVLQLCDRNNDSIKLNDFVSYVFVSLRKEYAFVFLKSLIREMFFLNWCRFDLTNVCECDVIHQIWTLAVGFSVFWFFLFSLFFCIIMNRVSVKRTSYRVLSN